MFGELTLDEIVEATGGALVDGPQTVSISGEEAVTSVSTDTRTLQPGALFVALRGETHDGHAHIDAAVRCGANALLVDHALSKASLPHIVVVDTLHAYGDIARCVRDSFAGPVVAVTGSVGKTTTKEMVAAVLGAHFDVLKSAANHNNEIGVPQTLFSIEARHGAIVVEMGMRGPGQILRLAEIAAPTIGIVTNIGASHVELLGSRENIAAAKGELFELLPEDGVAIFPADDPYAGVLRARFKGKTTYACGLEGGAAAADLRATNLTPTAEGWRCTAQTPWGTTELFVPSPGRFNVLNALFAVAVGGHLGIPLDAVADALAHWTPPPMRLEILHTTRGVTLLSDAYNAAPDSMIGALETLRDTTLSGAGAKRIAILGEMRELGAFADEGHRLVGQAVARTAPDMLIVVGPLAQRIGAAARVDGFPADRVHGFDSTEEAVVVVPAIVQPGDAALVKGSRALAMERLVEALR